MKTPTHGPRSTGFALVITLALMILLTLLAVGLLTLSSISLRASAQGTAMATARANARLALMLALGELQKCAGPDQRITARADVLDAYIANPRLTGVWNSWEIKATAPPAAAEYEKAARDAKFQGWLVSGTDPLKTRQIGFASQAPSSPVTLWGTGTLGDNPPANSFVSATKVPLAAAATALPGAYAWAVLDEGVKARINTHYADDATSAGTKTLELGAGERPGVEFIPGLNGFERKFFEKNALQSATIDKGISRLNFALAGEAVAPGKKVREALKPLTHDVTTHSLGLFTDTVHGGFKQDFHLLTNSTSLPTGYEGKGVYVSRLGLTAAQAPSDPRWESFQQFARLYRDKLSDAGGVPVLQIQTPGGWVAASQAGTTTTVNRTPPPGVVLLPTIAKVQVLFSLIGRDIYMGLPAAPIMRPLTMAEKATFFNGAPAISTTPWYPTDYNYELNLLYTPIITLHNPYNVALEFTSMRVEFVHVPFAMRIYRDGIAQTPDLVPLEKMYGGPPVDRSIYGVNLKTKVNGAPGSTTFRLLPGEVKVFSAYLNPDDSWLNQALHNTFYDVWADRSLTSNRDAIPGWRGDGIGIDCGWLGGGLLADNNPWNGHINTNGIIGLKWDSKIHVEFAPLSIPASNNKFVVRMSANLGADTTPTIVSAIEMDYESPTGLRDFIATNGGVTMPMRYPKSPNEFISGYEIVDRAATPIKDLTRLKPFALLSAQAKTTSGGRDVSNEDGRLATKPWCFAHANIGASTQKVVSEHSANFSHEIDLQLLEKGTANLVQVDQQDRGNFISGNTGFNGTKFGGQYDIPLAPLQTLAGLNGANPGGSSGYLPLCAQPIGNSWAHPLIPPEQLSMTKVGGNYVDHSFLLNLALYDNCYFSGLADQSGPYCIPARTTTALAAGFVAGKTLDDPRLFFRPPDGRQAADFASEVAKPDAYVNIGAWQLMEGAFNINSTSVPAWKAMLASIHDSQALNNQLLKLGAPPTSALSVLPATAAGKQARISRFRLPVSLSAAQGGEPKDGYWLGPREYADAELQTLAENIVKQVRLRGPFLSLAEFVNRRLGSGDTAQRGALQQAIDDSNLNPALAIAANAGFEIPAAAVSNYKYNNPAAGAGPSYQGAPGYLTQADLLNVLGNAATPRSDTFTIRGYGEARDTQGKILARATCEALVQRFPEWLDPADPVATAMKDLKSLSNKTFGRRFLITSFRWLNSNEI